ncbi:MAG: YHYH domain-containing protein [Idiomarina sp.]
MILAFCLFNISAVLGHGGGTNAHGCHTNHKTGNYHCHNSKSAPTTPTYCHVVNGEKRCGYALSTCQSLVRKFGGHCE